MSNNKHCFYCGSSLIDVNINGLHHKKPKTRSDDHFYPKNHPKYDKYKKVLCCVQCNHTKMSGDPIKFMEALEKIPLPEWGVKGLTKKWYKETGYRCGEFS